jgi:hypothetical protein
MNDLGMNHLSEEDLILLYYAEPGAPRHAKAHLAECAECRMAAVSLAQSLTLCNDLAVPERSVEFGRDTWTRLVPALSLRPEPKHTWRVPVWLTATALAIVLVVVFFAGRLSRPTVAPSPVLAGLSDQARERILEITVADHLDRVQNLLTEIDNDNGATTEGFADNRARAEDLVQEERLMRQSLAAQGETATTNFLGEVETVLTEAAHTSDSASAEQVRDLRDRIEAGSLLFKVRVVESNLRNEEQKL